MLLVLLIVFINYHSYRLIWVCSSPDFAGWYSLRLKVLSKTDSTAPLQFLALITPVTDIKRSFEKSFRRPMPAAERFSEKRLAATIGVSFFFQKIASARLPA